MEVRIIRRFFKTCSLLVLFLVSFLILLYLKCTVDVVSDDILLLRFYAFVLLEVRKKRRNASPLFLSFRRPFILFLHLLVSLHVLLSYLNATSFQC